VCDTHSECEHGFHLFGAAEYAKEIAGDGSCDTTQAGGGFPQIFSDGFESAGTSLWSAAVP
jgi:hypothetical protein